MLYMSNMKVWEDIEDVIKNIINEVQSDPFVFKISATYDVENRSMGIIHFLFEDIRNTNKINYFSIMVHNYKKYNYVDDIKKFFRVLSQCHEYNINEYDPRQLCNIKPAKNSAC